GARRDLLRLGRAARGQRRPARPLAGGSPPPRTGNHGQAISGRHGTAPRLLDRGPAFPRPLRPPDHPHGGGARISRSAPRRERDRWPAGLAAGLDPLLLSVQSHGAARGGGPGGIHSGRSAGGAPDRGPPFRRPHGAGRFGGLRSSAAVGSAPTTRD